MLKNLRTNEVPCTVKVVVATPKTEKIWIKICDAKHTRTFYSKRYSRVNGEKTFYITMPISPEVAKLVVYRDKENPVKSYGSFRILEVEILPLTNTSNIQMSRKTKSFVKFIQEFSEEAGYLPASPHGETYRSDNGKFRIDFFDKIRSKQTKKVIGTPARISQKTGRIEVSKSAFNKYSVPMRMAILLHEYAHFYLNENPSDESEADINGLRIYLALGYPRIDAYNVFLNVFKTASSKQSLHRYEQLDAFIKEWDYGKG